MSTGTVLSALLLAALSKPLCVALRPVTDLLDLSFKALGSGCPERRKLSAERDEVAHPREDADLGDKLVKAQHLPVIRESPWKRVQASDVESPDVVESSFSIARPNPEKSLIVTSRKFGKDAKPIDRHLVEALAIVALLDHAKGKGRVLVEPVHHIVISKLPGSAIVVLRGFDLLCLERCCSSLCNIRVALEIVDV